MNQCLQNKNKSQMYFQIFQVPELSLPLFIFSQIWDSSPARGNGRLKIFIWSILQYVHVSY